jgi:NAD(P)-dependent dehydrogenase (short-subunit alcohol dehydrogenase family)
LVSVSIRTFLTFVPSKTNIMNTLKNKKAVILGGSSGIGLATAKAAANHGAEVIIVSANQQRVDNALTELPENAQGFAVNLTDEQQVQSFFTNLGKFDHLVFTAGESLQLNKVADTTLTDAKQFFDVRYWGAFTAVKYAAPNINAGGSIVLTSGSAAQRPGSGWSLGASICAAMEGFTRAMAIELAPIRVNIVAPGLVKTNLWSNMSEQEREGLYTHYAGTLPVKYVASADDIAQSYIYLMCQPYSTGQRVVVDGGAVLV